MTTTTAQFNGLRVSDRVHHIAQRDAAGIDRAVVGTVTRLVPAFLLGSRDCVEVRWDYETAVDLYVPTDLAPAA